MKKCKIKAEKGRVVGLIHNLLDWDKDELSKTASELQKINDFIYKIYVGENTIDNVPVECRNYVQECVDYISSVEQEALHAEETETDPAPLNITR